MRKHIVLCLITAFYTFQLFAQPVISSFSPQSGPVGTSVIISGANFSTTLANNIVLFGAVKASVTAATPTSLTITVPAGATYQPFSVTVNNLTGYAKQPFIVTFAGGSSLANNPDQSQYSFAPRIDFRTDLHPNGVTVADFDGDGKADIATANNYSTAGSPASVSVLRNTGSSAIDFAPRIDIATGVLTYAVASGDLNGDGKIDLVSSSIAGKTISVFQNISSSGNILFAPKLDLATGTNPYSIAIADFDGDGKPDIVVANYLSNTVSIYRNTGSGNSLSFATKVDFTTGLAPRSVATGDFDNDGKIDIAVSNELSNTISVFRNTSTSGLVNFAGKVDYNTNGNPYGVAVGDMNLDGLSDVVVVNNSSNNFSVFRNTSATPGSVSFAAKVDVGCADTPYNPFICDLNGDSKPDVGIASMNVSVHQNNSTGASIAFSNQAYLFMGTGPFVVAAGDFDQDGESDLAAGLFTLDKVSVLRNINNEPSVRLINPNPAASGTTVTLSGGNFNTAKAVLFGGVPASSFTVVNATTITAVVGTGASGDVTVTNQYGSGILSGFVFAGPPVITSFTPSGTGTDNTVTIKGNNFTGATAVSFAGVPAASFTVVSPTTIDAVVGSGATGNISVTTPYGTATAGGFSFLLTPTIASFTPSSAATGQTVTITGTNFTGTTDVRFGGVPAASFAIQSATQLTAVIGNGSSGDVTVTNAYGSLSRPGFTYIPPPQINSYTPQAGSTGTTITINGNNFAGATAVNFGGLPANSFTVNSATSITAVVGAGASGAVSVVAPGGTTSANDFTFLPPPAITSFTPLTAPAGTTLTINGNNFGSTIGANKVMIGSVEVPVTSASSTVLQVTVPEVAINEKITVTTKNLLAFSEQNFQTTHPSVQSAFSASSFASRLNLKGAFASYCITNADIDGDGKPDIVLPDLGSKAVAIFRNTSTNTISFAPRVEATSAWVPISIEAGDLDGDGKVDLIAGTEGDTISLLRNLSTPGNVSFAPKIDLPTPLTGFISVTLGDVDGDGRLDIAARTGTSGTAASVTVYLNKSVPGNLNFANPVTYPIGSNGTSLTWICLEDLDGDHKPEIITNGSGITVFKNNCTPGNLSFPSSSFVIAANSFPITISANDIDGDGKKDIIASSNTYTISVYRNTSTTGTFSFMPFTVYTSLGGVHDIKTGDLDGDGKPELVYSQGAGGSDSSYLNRFSVFKNNSSPSLVNFATRVDYPYTYYYHYNLIDLADFDGDNGLDLVLTFSGADSTFIFQNQTGRANTISMCEGDNTAMNANATSSTYQWQVNAGSGFVNINGNDVYSGTNSSVLQITNASAVMNGNLYRCRLDSGYSSIHPLNVNAKGTPAIAIDYNGCGSSSLVFTSVVTNGGGNPKVDWYVNNAFVSTGQSFTLANPVNGAQVYAKLTSSLTCATPQIATSSVVAINCVTTAVPNVDYLESFTISPNPTTGVITIQMKLRQLNKFSIRITDGSGKTVYTSKPVNVSGNVTKQIDLRGMEQGIYYLETTLNDKRFTEKILVVK
jgi:hypothetical protein